jgi:two-component system, NtrC family, response regulator HydG
MKPSLAAISGPLKGKKIIVSEQEWSIGRGEASHLHLDDKSASRNHCIIKIEGSQFKIIDLDSKNGTFVESIPIKEHDLKHGESIRIGDSVFIFLIEQEESTKRSDSLQMQSEHLQSFSTIRLQQDESIYLHPEKVSTLLPEVRIAQDLSVLLKFSSEITLIKSRQSLYRRLLELILESIPAQKGAILLHQPAPEEFIHVCSLDRAHDQDVSVSINQAIVTDVIKDGAGVLYNQILNSDVKSVLCSPIQFLKKCTGVIYLTSNDPSVNFDKNHLQLLTAMTAMFAITDQNLLQTEQLQNENRQLREEIHIQHQMVGESHSMKQIYHSIEKIAPTDATILIYGETGTGKELIARAIHNSSPRAENPFVAINCAALTEALLESEMFGHEKGAFTGAVAQKKGKMELADTGTLFLDEVAELSLPLQAKLLRALQERTFERVGGTRPVAVDVRLIAATNKDLKHAVNIGTFRDDLYYRLNVVSIKSPSLKDRKEDISLLANFFTAKYSKQFKRRITGISSEAKACLQRYSWPGNVRELENAIERAVVMGSSEMILPEDLPETILETGSIAGVNIGRYQDAILDAKRAVILKAVEQANGNYAEAAKILGVQRTYLHRVMRNLKLKKSTLR